MRDKGDGDDHVRKRGEREPEDDDDLEALELDELGHEPARDGRRNPRHCG